MTRPLDLAVRECRLLDDRQVDVGIRDGRIAEVGPVLAAPARRDVDAGGRLLTPGLIDLHTHVFAGGSYWGIAPEAIAAVSGVTTWVDAGSAGAYTVEAFARTVAPYHVRIKAFLHISGPGLAAQTGESVSLVNVDVAAAVDAVQRHRDLIRGVKIRCDVNACGDNGLEPLRRGLQVAEDTGLPVMVHIGYAPPDAGEVMSLLRPGDVLTHCCTAVADGLLAADGRPTAEVRGAYERGVVFDLGHGSGGFGFAVAERFAAEGIRPHVLSTDLHSRSLTGPVFDLPHVLMKALALGWTLPEAFAGATTAPAHVLGVPDEQVAIVPGAVADLALWDVEEVPVEVVDAHREVRTSPLRLANALTIVGGTPFTSTPHPPGWLPPDEATTAALRRRETDVHQRLAAPLLAAGDVGEAFPVGDPEVR